jgi:hypothetical protein
MAKDGQELEDRLEDAEGRLMACEALLTLLVARMNRDSPDFAEKAKKALDTILGKRAAGGKPAEEHEVIARREFMAIIEKAPSLAEPAPSLAEPAPSLAKPATWWRQLQAKIWSGKRP